MDWALAASRTRIARVGTSGPPGDGGSAIRFWPLVSGTTLADAAPAPPAHPLRPGKPNTIVIANFGLVDVAVPLPADAPLTRTKVEPAKLGLPARVAGRGVNRAELYADQNGNPNIAQLTFAVDAGHARNPYECELQLTIEFLKATRNGVKDQACEH